MQYRHGDVLLERIEELPDGKCKPLPHTILAHGEVTGHSHRVKEAKEAKLYETDTELALEVIGEAVTIIHEEHGDISLPQGLYRVWRQREYSPEEIRVIRD